MQLRRLSGEEKWKGRLQLRKRKDHFIFTVQSTGVRSSPSQTQSAMVEATVHALSFAHTRFDSLQAHLRPGFHYVPVCCIFGVYAASG